MNVTTPVSKSIALPKTLTLWVQITSTDYFLEGVESSNKNPIAVALKWAAVRWFEAAYHPSLRSIESVSVSSGGWTQIILHYPIGDVRYFYLCPTPVGATSMLEELRRDPSNKIVRGFFITLTLESRCSPKGLFSTSRLPTTCCEPV